MIVNGERDLTCAQNYEYLFSSIYISEVWHVNFIQKIIIAEVLQDFYKVYINVNFKTNTINGSH